MSIDTGLTAEQVDKIRVLINGCGNHPAYRAKRKPKSYCRACDTLWEYKNELTSLLNLNNEDEE